MVKVQRPAVLFSLPGTSAQAGTLDERPDSASIRNAGSACDWLNAVHVRALQQLQSIGSWRVQHLGQPHADLDSLYQIAGQGQQELGARIRRIAALTGTLVLPPSLKSRSRARAKISSELGGQAVRLTDLVRTSVIADDIPGLLQAFAVLKEQAAVVQVKNRFNEPTASGYRDLNVLVRLPESRMIAEIQFHLHRIAVVKNGPEHQLYEQIQRIERHALTQRRPLTDIEQARVTRLRDTSRRLYQHAWQYHLPGLPAGRLTSLPLSA